MSRELGSRVPQSELMSVSQLGYCPSCNAFIRFRVTNREEIVAEKHNNPKTHKCCEKSLTIVDFGEQHL